MQLHLTGQWKGSFTLGKEYGDLEGDVTEFMMFLNENDGVFEGKCFEIAGKFILPNAGLSVINGFIVNDAISFTQKYNHAIYVDEEGNIYEDFLTTSQIVNFMGKYNENLECFEGTWEIIGRTEINSVGIIQDYCSGTWEMKKEVQ
ncbi:MAG: hypothetical protein K2X48_06610 [Chitinophagaceae bacterium]|nr:hypothetical protein [Chitinophagaceae bacterium]